MPGKLIAPPPTSQAVSSETTSTQFSRHLKKSGFVLCNASSRVYHFVERNGVDEFHKFLGTKHDYIIGLHAKQAASNSDQSILLGRENPADSSSY